MAKSPYTKQELAAVLSDGKQPARHFATYDLDRVNWRDALTLPGCAGEFWRNYLGRMCTTPVCRQHPEEQCHKVLAHLFNKAFPKYRYSPQRAIAAAEMVLAKVKLACGELGCCEDTREHDEKKARRWLKFPYDKVILRGNRDRARFAELGVLPGEPDPEPEYEDTTPMAKKKTTSKKKKVSKKVSTAPGGGKKTLTKKKVSKKKTSTKASADKPARDRPFGRFTAFSAETGEPYDRRLGRPGTARDVFCKLLTRSKGATRKELVTAAVKAGLYKGTDEGRQAAENQLKMNLMSFKRDEEAKGLTLTEINDDKWSLSVKLHDKVKG